MIETLTVFTGEIKTAGREFVLKSSPIGSCVVVILFDEAIQFAGMAHIMLPGKAPEKSFGKEGKIKSRYAENAIDMLIEKLTVRGLVERELKAVVVGGGNVLKRAGDKIGLDNINSVKMILTQRRIPIVAQTVGGTERFSARIDIDKGIIYCSIGNKFEEILYRIYHKV